MGAVEICAWVAFIFWCGIWVGFHLSQGEAKAYKEAYIGALMWAVNTRCSTCNAQAQKMLKEALDDGNPS
jgi:hypothetical protein